MATAWRPRSWRPRRILPRAALSVVLAAALVATVAAPGHAQPDAIPDPGVRPAPSGEVPLPGGGFPRPPTDAETPVGPLAAEIAEVEIRIDTLTAELSAIDPEVAPARAAATTAQQDWQTARDELAAAEGALASLVEESYQGAAALPAALYIPELRGLSAHAPGLPVDAPIGASAAARELARKQQAERITRERYESAQLTEQELTQRRDELTDELAQREDELADLRERNNRRLIAQEQARDAAAQEGADQNLDLEPVDGFRPHPRAVAAVEFALGEIGKPYLWGAEGPDRYDCSGLVWRSYRTVGRTLPRVAADQYLGTDNRLVTRSAIAARRGLLPGDLVFFSTGPSPRSVHHVGMYVGNGQMVHAPNRNELVQVSPVWWSRFFAATRVFQAVPVADDETPDPGQTPTPTPGPSPTQGVIRPTAPATTTPPTTPPTTTPPTTSPPPTGPTPVEIPVLAEDSQTEAVAELEGLGLVVTVVEVDSPEPAGTVLGTEPPAGSSVLPDTPVTVLVSNGSLATPSPSEPPTGTPTSPPPAPS